MIFCVSAKWETLMTYAVAIRKDIAGETTTVVVVRLLTAQSRDQTFAHVLFYKLAKKLGELTSICQICQFLLYGTQKVCRTSSTSQQCSGTNKHCVNLAIPYAHKFSWNVNFTDFAVKTTTVKILRFTTIGVFVTCVQFSFVYHHDAGCDQHSRSHSVLQ